EHMLNGDFILQSPGDHNPLPSFPTRRSSDLARQPVADTQRLVIVARDAASEARFGVGAWDRAMLARVVAALGRGGAVVVGLDVALGSPSAPGRGGAAGDALLIQAAQAVDAVFVVSPATPRSSVPEAKVGHAVAEPDVD